MALRRRLLPFCRRETILCSRALCYRFDLLVFAGRVFGCHVSSFATEVILVGENLIVGIGNTWQAAGDIREAIFRACKVAWRISQFRNRNIFAVPFFCDGFQNELVFRLVGHQYPPSARVQLRKRESNHVGEAYETPLSTNPSARAKSRNRTSRTGVRSSPARPPRPSRCRSAPACSPLDGMPQQVTHGTRFYPPGFSFARTAASLASSSFRNATVRSGPA